ncbi:MAG: 2,3-bisphosphoglycerate-independent phosphoglycerate mutase [Thermodesulfobacteriota bacterium]|nr:2,3-bisphosphoglycerate-independent phosphoglycerate mutase [Thermodesulfobacteriota bacterium]
MNQPCMLVILDGWGINPESKGNAVAAANTPNLDKLFADYPNTRLVCSGEAVGLPPGFMGNSEVGHLNIGAGRIVYQELMKINRAIDDGSFFTNNALTSIINAVKSNNGVLHLMGLVSDGGVHSHINHLKALVKMATEQGLNVRIHAILDGRDTPPDSGKDFIADLDKFLASYDTARIATVCGRYYAMDRDTRWDRTERAYRLYTLAEGTDAANAETAVQQAYANGETDEFVKPVTVTGDTIDDNDGVIFFNFRADRARQIVRAFTDPDFGEFERNKRPALSDFVCMTLYDKTFTAPVAFPPENPGQTLGEIISRLGLAQLRIAETEKYAHVTYFFNGGIETPFTGEDRKLIPSPREVATYDEKPEMSARAVAEELVARIQKTDYALIVVNFANMDMVGHTGIFDAAVNACETVDECVGKIVPAFLKAGGAVMVTADHGNAEQMTAENGSPHTAHTHNQVPLILVDDNQKNATLLEGKLGDIAPTILALMGLNQPDEMTGTSLLGHDKT